VTTSTTTTKARPAVRIAPFFWWLREADRQSATTKAYVALPGDYIPAGTADLWRTARPGAQL
jgi:hypothetical protein